MWPGFDSQTQRHMWVEFVAGSCPRSKGFSMGSLVFLPPQKPTLLNSNSIREQWMKSQFVGMPLQNTLLFTELQYIFINYNNNYTNGCVKINARTSSYSQIISYPS